MMKMRLKIRVAVSMFRSLVKTFLLNLSEINIGFLGFYALYYIINFHSHDVNIIVHMFSYYSVLM